METAIKKAIEGGWKPQEYGYHPSRGVTLVGFDLNGSKLEIHVERKGEEWDWKRPYVGDQQGSFWVHISQVYSDPSFWQCLGKAMGWEKTISPRYWKYKDGTPPRAEVVLLDQWENQMHSFVQHLIMGEPVEEFFNKILK